MRWSSSERAYDARVAAIEHLLENLVPRGRLCLALHCTAQSELAFMVGVDGVRGWAAFCVAHAPLFAVDHPELLLPVPPRKLGPDVVLGAPISAEGVEELLADAMDAEGEHDQGGEPHDP